MQQGQRWRCAHYWESSHEGGSIDITAEKQMSDDEFVNFVNTNHKYALESVADLNDPYTERGTICRLGSKVIRRIIHDKL